VLGSEGSGPVSPNPSELGSVIRRLRQERELSIESLAAASGIHTTYLSGIERGRRNPSWNVIGALADALGVEISDLARLAEELAGSGSVGQESS
jgi:transcriptional regulator with XRE-family HTH domain